MLQLRTRASTLVRPTFSETCFQEDPQAPNTCNPCLPLICLSNLNVGHMLTVPNEITVPPAPPSTPNVAVERRQPQTSKRAVQFQDMFIPRLRFPYPIIFRSFTFTRSCGASAVSCDVMEVVTLRSGIGNLETCLDLHKGHLL